MFIATLFLVIYVKKCFLSSRCVHCGVFYSPNKFIFHCHRTADSKYRHPDAANFNSWRRHLHLDHDTAASVSTPMCDTDALMNAWEDVKAMFNGGSRKRLQSAASPSSGISSPPPRLLSPSQGSDDQMMSQVIDKPTKDDKNSFQVHCQHARQQPTTPAFVNDKLTPVSFSVSAKKIKTDIEPSLHPPVAESFAMRPSFFLPNNFAPGVYPPIAPSFTSSAFADLLPTLRCPLSLWPVIPPLSNSLFHGCKTMPTNSELFESLARSAYSQQFHFNRSTEMPAYSNLSWMTNLNESKTREHSEAAFPPSLSSLGDGYNRTTSQESFSSADEMTLKASAATSRVKRMHRKKNELIKHSAFRSIGHSDGPSSRVADVTSTSNNEQLARDGDVFSSRSDRLTRDYVSER